MSAPEDRKISVTLTPTAIEGIRRIALANNTTLATAIADSVRINEILTEAEKNSAKILLAKPDGTMVEVVRSR